MGKKVIANSLVFLVYLLVHMNSNAEAVNINLCTGYQDLRWQGSDGSYCSAGVDVEIYPFYVSPYAIQSSARDQGIAYLECNPTTKKISITSSVCYKYVPKSCGASSIKWGNGGACSASVSSSPDSSSQNVINSALGARSIRWRSLRLSLRLFGSSGGVTFDLGRLRLSGRHSR